MHLGFTGRRHNFHKRQYCLHLRNGHIGNSNVADQPFSHQFFTLSVCIHKFFHRKWSGIRISGIHITSRCMVVREWPVNKEQINVVTLQVLNAFSAGFLYSLMHIIPYFCHNEQIFSFYHTFFECRMEYLSDLIFVSITCRTVKHTVSAADCSCHCI